jgi:hypothetical protein
MRRLGVVNHLEPIPVLDGQDFVTPQIDPAFNLLLLLAQKKQESQHREFTLVVKRNKLTVSDLR